jgi:hypothetical protein
VVHAVMLLPKMFASTPAYYDIRCPMVRAELLEQTWNAESRKPPRSVTDDQIVFGVVAPRAHRSLHHAVEWMATYFQHERGYSFPQYDTRSGMESLDANLRAYVWADTHGVDTRNRIPVFGAICFRLRQPSGRKPYYGAQWAWLHPYQRRNGHLTRAWPYFEKRFGHFVPEPPFSDEMRGFLTKQGRSVDETSTRRRR